MNKKEYFAELLDDIPNLDPNMINSFAQLDIGELYCFKTNVPDNYEKAFYWLSLAGQQRNRKAQFLLGDLYSLGKGTEQDELTAYQWYMKSAIQGYPKALTRLHNLHHTEKGMACRGQRNAEEEEWTQPKFKEQHKIRELFEYRLEQMASELTKTKQYFTALLDECRKQNTVNAHLTLGFLYQHGYGIRKITARAIEFYTLAAEKGNVDAQYNLASIYHAHHDMKWNYREAFKWYTKAAENGSTYAQSGLAFFYQHGLGVDIDYSKTIYWYTQAAEMRNVKAQISLGCIFRKGEIVDQDLAKAIEWYKRATKEGSQVAQNCLDLLCSNNNTPSNGEADLSLEEKAPKLYSKKGLCSRLRDDVDTITVPATLKAFERLASNAMKKDGNAMLEIGLNYYHGTQFQQDKNTAFRWIRKAAKSGLIKAQCLIAEMYKNGDCIEQDYLKSGIWYSRAAKQGDSTAQYQLGQMYYQGLGVRKDPLEASKWYTFAAEKKHGDAQYQLGYLREKGEGLRQDVPQAIQFYKKSAMQKNPEAIYKLGIMRESGNGVKPDFKYALKFYKKAADLACLNAQLRLGHLYSDRDGSVFSVENASKYFKMAADQNHPEAKYRLAIMYLHGDGIKQDLTLAYNLFTESRKLHHKESNSLFQAPSSIIQNPDVDSEKFQDILTLACRNNFSSLEYTLADFYEQQSIQYKLFRYTSNRKLRLAKTWYKAAASKNNPKAQYKLGQMYMAGQGVSQDWVRAVGYYEDARKNGNTDAIYTLAQLYLTGRGVSQNFQKAFDLYTEASNKGPIDAADLLFVSYQTVNGDKHVDYKRLLEEVANSGNTVIQHQLGILYLTDELLNYDGVQKGIEWLSRSSKGGYVLSPYHLGILYEEGIMIPQNYETAISLYQLAEDEGNGNALYRLARLYHYGNGVKCDYRKAFDLYTNAAKYGNPLARAAIKITNNSIWSSLMNGARDIKCPVLDYDSCLQMWEYVANTGSPDLQYQLGKVYEQMGSKLYLNQAKKWYSKAASYSHGPSLFRLGRLFESGNGVEKNYKKTIELYKKSALQHNNDALRALGNIYQQGNDVKSNLSKSFGYYSSAAENGDSKAQFILGTLYERELVENGSFLDAFKWFSVAASQGNEEAHSHLNELDDNFNDSRNKRFDFKLLQLLSKLTKLEINNNGLGREFFGDVHYRLACMYYSGHGTPVDYEKAWDNFNKSYENYGESRAADFFNIGSRDLNSSMKAEYLKKLEMWESVASRLKKEKVYELGMIYYYGIYGDTDTSEPDNVCAIIEPNTLKSTKYFKMVIDIKLPDDYQYFGHSSYYLGMVHYMNPKFQEKALYYLCNALLGEYPTAGTLLKSICRNEKSNAYEQILVWHQSFQFSKHPDIFCNIGHMYYKGVGVEKDYSMAFRQYKDAADQGSSDAQCSLGTMYKKGHGTEKNIDLAIKWYDKAAKENNPDACYSLGAIYCYGQGVEKDYGKALEYFKGAADQGNSDAQYSLGDMYELGYGTEKNINSAIDWYKKAADQNHPYACYSLGFIYCYDQGSEKNYRKALKYFKNAADQGNSDAQYSLGNMHELGYGTEKNINSAIDWYKKAAAQNNTPANITLGSIYCYDLGTGEDYNKALEYYRAADVQENSNDRFGLGYCYFYGGKDKDKGIKIMEENSRKSVFALITLGEIYHSASPKHQNFTKALGYYHKVPEGDSRRYALRGIGLLYEHGDGVKKSPQKALKYYRKAADEQNRGAYYNIALLYYYGIGVFRNYSTSFQWFSRVIAEEMDERCTHVCVVAEKQGQDKADPKKIYSKEPESFIWGEAYYYLGSMFKNGQGTAINQEKSVEHLRMAVSYGSSKAQRLINEHKIK